jgi:CHAT domain-containing protein
VIALAGYAAPAMAQSTSCTGALGVPAASAAAVKTLGTQPASVNLALTPGHSYLIEVIERDNDALVEVLGSKGELLSQSDHPERRTGTRRAVLTAPETGSISVRVTGKEHANAAGTATVRAFDLAGLDARPDCLAVIKTLAAADAHYAAGQAISRGLASAGSGAARDAYHGAAENYESAERRLNAPADRALRGQTELALAALEYQDLSDWAKTVQWAQAASANLAAQDPYRQARADALVAAAWIQIGRSTSAGRPAPGYARSSGDLLAQARTVLERLRQFHLRRGERYDAALQSTNIALTYLNEARFSNCVAASGVASRLFGSLHELQRRAQAWQNTALCLWGLGRLPDALQLLERARQDVGEQPYPNTYISVLNNTALVDYALGHFDESLALLDRAKAFAERVQLPHYDAQSLFGIGINYYALGDLERARYFLKLSLAIRTVELDRRGRMQTLRALATVDADQGSVDEAIAYDREALSLAVAQASIERITMQLAVHTAAAGHLEEARSQLDALISRGVGTDPAIEAEALLQRASILRRLDRPRDALADLEKARPRLHRLGNIDEEFAANLELARTLRVAGEPRQALAAVDEALREADAVRLQTANPEFRLQLQTPLRAAYDLKIELLRASYDDALAAGKERQAGELAAAAFVTADASRARSLADVAAEEYSPAIRRELAPQFRRREALYEELAGREFALEQHFDSAGSEDARARHLMSDIAELERQIDTLNTLIAGRASPDGRRAAGGVTPGTVLRVPANTALISYWLGAESAYAWVVLADQIHWTRLSSPEGIRGLATAFQRSLTRFVDIHLEPRMQDSRALSDEVLAPIERWVLTIPQWVVIPDGALDYVPFAALITPGGGAGAFVIARHDVAVTPAAWMLDAVENRPPPATPGSLLLVADPVYQPDDPRLAPIKEAGKPIQAPKRDPLDRAREDYRRLAFTAQEASGIAAEFPAGSVDELLGLDATRARLLALDWSQYRYIHIATHGIVDAQVPDLSALILGSYDSHGDLVDGAVRVADLSLRTIRADVAVFSACDTALGKQVPSEGLVGISSTMLARGAKAVVASLWQVSDEIGARLMTELYRHMLRDSMSAPAALGTAMRSALSRSATADPALWAAYQVSVVALGPGLPIRDVNTVTTTRP